MKAIKVSPKRCVSCEICSIICSVTNSGQPRGSAMRIRIKRQYPDPPSLPFRPMVCQNCDEPKCVEACLPQALVVDKEIQQVLLLESKCDGCGLCIEACPFEAIWIDPLKNVAIKCDLCGGDPECVKMCRFDAIKFPF